MGTRGTLNDLARSGRLTPDGRRDACMASARKAREKGLRRTYGALRLELVNMMRLTAAEAAHIVGEDERVYANRNRVPELVTSDRLLHSVHLLLDHRRDRARHFQSLGDRLLLDIANRPPL